VTNRNNQPPVLRLQLGLVGLVKEMEAAGLDPSPANQALVLELMRLNEPNHLNQAVREAVKKIRESN